MSNELTIEYPKEWDDDYANHSIVNKYPFKLALEDGYLYTPMSLQRHKDRAFLNWMREKDHAHCVHHFYAVGAGI